MSLLVEQLSKNYGEQKIFTDVNIAISNKQFIGIIGPNGSGKSTLLKCIYRVLNADSGQITIDDTPLESMSYKKSAQKMAVVGQHHQYNFDFSVEDIVMMGRTPHQTMLEKSSQKDVDLVNSSLERVSMSDMVNRLFSTLSGGEQQRVILARAFAQDTDYLILDEPTNHLDVKHQMSLLKMVKKSGITTFAALHDLNMAALFCDYIYVLNNTKIEAYGKPQEVLTPELIKGVYQVESEIVYDSNGKMHILFLESI